MKPAAKRSSAPGQSKADSADMSTLMHRLKAASYRMLESRMVFDGAAADTLTQMNSASPHAPEAPADDSSPHLAALLGVLAAAPTEPAHAGTTIVFIDSRVSDRDLIAAAVPAGAEIVVLDADRDGVDQIAEVLAGRSDIAAVHIVSHGSQGQILLGNATLDAESMQGRYRDDLLTIGHALTADGDILIYGCDFAAGEIGLDAANILADITGADVAASVDSTGTALLGADWDLEARTGPIEAQTIDAASWGGLLGAFDISVDGDTTFSVTGGGGVGTEIVVTNAGDVGGTSIDLVGTVVATTGTAFVADVRPASVNFPGSDDVLVEIQGIGAVTIRWEVFESGSGRTVHAVGDPTIGISDIDGNAPGSPIETVTAKRDGLVSYTTDSPTNLELTVGADTFSFSGTANQNNETTSVGIFNWENVSSFELTYTVTASGRFFVHDGDGDFLLELVNPQTTSIREPPALDLDTSDNAPLPAATDTFESNGYSGGTGWSTSGWTESGEATNAASGDIQIVDDNGTHAIRLGDTNDSVEYIQNTVDLTGAATATLSLQFRNAGLDDTTEFVDVEISTDGVNFVQLDRFDSTHTSSYATHTYDISAYISAHTTIRFSASTSLESSDFGFIDNVAITTTVDQPTGHDTTFFLGGGPVAIADASDAISDADSINMESATLTLTNPQAGDTLALMGALPGGIVASAYDSGTGTLTLTGTATKADYQAALALIGFSSTSDSTAIRFVDVSVNDGMSDSNVAVAAITVVNPPPVPHDPDPTPGTPSFDTLDPNNLIVPATDNVPVAVDLDDYFIDPNGDPLTFTPNLAGLPGWVSYDPVTHVLSGTPPIDNAGSVAIPVTVDDGHGGTLAATVTLAPVNPGPDAVDDSTSTAYLTPVVVDLLANDSDPDGDPISVVSASVPAAQGTVAFDGTHWVFTPAVGFSGAATITYTIADQDGGTDTATHTVTVANAPPVPHDPDPAPGTPAFDTVDPSNLVVPATDNVPVAVDLDDYFIDPNGDPLTFTPNLVGLPGWVSYDPVTHVLSGTPPIDNAGSVAIPVTVDDGQGGTLAATVTLAPVNPGPNAVADSSATTHATPVVVDLLANDTDPDGDPISVVSASVPAAQGTIIFDGTHWIFTPATGFAGVATITYTITDQDGATDTATHTVTVANAPPEPHDPDPTPGTPAFDAADPNNLVVPATDNVPVAVDLDGYFTDPNGDPLTFTPNLAGLPGWVHYDPVTHVLSGTPPVDNAGPVAIPVTVEDGKGGSITATITFAPVNPGPHAVDGTSSTEFARPVVVDLLANDSDPDGDPLTVLSASVPAEQGTIVFDGTHWIFTPAPGFAGVATITYTIIDQDGATDTATHTVTVADPPPPLLASQGFQVTPLPQQVPETVSVEGIVLESVRQIGSLGSISGQISQRGIVVDTVNAVSALGGLPAVSDATTVANAAGPLRAAPPTEIWQSTPDDLATPARAVATWDAHGLTGFSLRMGLSGGGSSRSQLIVESLVRDDNLIVQLSSSMPDKAKRVVEYRVGLPGGARLPAWLDRVGPDLLMGRRPANVERVALQITVVYADRTSETKIVEIEAATGEVRPRAISRHSS